MTEFPPAIMFGVFAVLIMLGYPVMLERSGLAEDLLETMALVFGRLPGGHRHLGGRGGDPPRGHHRHRGRDRDHDGRRHERAKDTARSLDWARTAVQ